MSISNFDHLGKEEPSSSNLQNLASHRSNINTERLSTDPAEITQAVESSSLQEQASLEEMLIHEAFRQNPLAQEIQALLEEEKITPKTEQEKETFNRVFCEKITILINQTSNHQLALILPKLIQNAYFFRDPFEAKQTGSLLVSSILAAIAKKEPELEKFMHVQGGIISPQGIELIVKILQAKSSFPPGIPFHVCDNIEAFAEKVKKLDPDDRLPVNAKEVFFIRCQGGAFPGLTKNSVHIAPAYMEKTAEGWNLVLPTASNSDSEASLLGALLDNGREPYASSFASIKKIYQNPATFKRQADTINCPIFAIRDLVHLLKTPNALSNISQNAKPHEIDPERLFFYSPKDLPLEMLVYSQISKIYTEGPNQVVDNLQAPVASRKKGVQRFTPFAEKIQEHMRKQPTNELPKPLNMHIVDRAAKYLGWIVQHILRQTEISG